MSVDALWGGFSVSLILCGLGVLFTSVFTALTAGGTALIILGIVIYKESWT